MYTAQVFLIRKSKVQKNQYQVFMNKALHK